MNPFCFTCGQESIDCMCEKKKDSIEEKENTSEGLISKADMLDEIKTQYNRLLQLGYSSEVALKLLKIAYK